MAKLAIVASFLIISVLFGQFAWLNTVSDTITPQRFDEKANLALRRTGHHLLLGLGDSSSRIPAVKKIADHQFVLQLNKSFDYAQLPALLQESFALHQITTNYDVAVLDCKTSELQLGYNFQDYTKNDEVACGGRQRGLGCYTIQVTFAGAESVPTSSRLGWATGAGFVFYRDNLSALAEKEVATQSIEVADETTSRIYFGKSSIDAENQLLLCGDTEHNLTFREAKLLQLFINHKNQVLERDFILKSVWEDEGVIVSRSIDVFVSRLRKMLQSDTTLRLVAVHGVGYRLEIHPDENGIS